MARMETKRKIDESIALLNSVLDLPSKKHSLGQPPSSTPIPVDSGKLFSSSTPSSPSPSSTLLSPSLSSPQPRKRNFLPPRPAILDKLSRLSGSYSADTRPTLSDSIAASIAVSGTLSKSEGTIDSATNITRAESSSPQTATTPPSSTSTKQTGPFRAKWRYMPWSREQFDERLQTFKPSTWFGKPKLVSPIECSKRGWINTSDDRLECCGGCGGVVIVKLDQSTTDLDHLHNFDDDDDFNPDLDIEVLGPQFFTMLTENHAKNCPWKAHSCDDSINKFPVVSQQRACQELTERAERLKTMVGNPLIARIRHPLTAEQIEHIGQLVPEVTDPKLLALALFGWTASDKTLGLSCHACHTHCSYIPNSFDSTLDIIDDDDESGDEDISMEGVSKFAKFDVIHQHKWYCHWIDPQQNSPKKEAGWQILVQLLMPKNKRHSEVSAEVSRVLSDDASIDALRLEHLDAVAQIKRILRGHATPPSPSSLTK
ncbi:hypothetical protein BG004_006910 [Podila humilis]|nr:hypothetical protein BG004_006910 [Podila humilis]